MAAHTRRRVLRGVLGGCAVAVGLPIFDSLLNGNGTALASGAPLPVRFGTWFWGLGVTQALWTPTAVGANYGATRELKPIAAFKDKVSVLSGFDVPLDGKPNFPHISGWLAFRSGTAPASRELPGPSFDVMISDVIGTQSRFRSLDATAIQDPANSLSGRGAGAMNPPESSAMSMYARLFGDEFQNPNDAGFTPDPMIMARRSVLSAVSEQRQDLERRLGAADRDRLDQYFTALRQTEQRLALQLEKPPALEACTVPRRPRDQQTGHDIELVVKTHDLMVNLLAMALACNQTKCFNLAFNNPTSALTRVGSTVSHHQLTHEEPLDPQLGYQPAVTDFVRDCMLAWGSFVQALATFREGGGTLLDNTLVLAHSETSDARVHSVNSLPIMIAGRAGGRINSGLHIAGRGTPASRVALTVMHLMGVPIDRWGTGSLETKAVISELIA